MRNNFNDGKQLNIGISLLKMLCSFAIVCCHFWSFQGTPALLIPFDHFKNYAVMIFMTLSFFLNYKLFSEHDVDGLKKRIWRIVWPQIGWAVIYYVIFALADLFFDRRILNGFSDFLWQMFFGHSLHINASMWFSFVSLVITVIFWGITKKFQEYEIGLFFVAIVALLFQYTGINYELFGNLRYELKYPLGRICEMIPCAVAGYYLAKFNVVEKIKKNKYCFILGLCALLFILENKSFFIVKNGFSCSGIKPVVVSCVLLIVFASFPGNNASKRLRNFINYISRHTMGIYCIHRLTATFINFFLRFLKVETETFLSCIIIYVVSFGVLEIMSHIPVKLIKQLVD